MGLLSKSVTTFTRICTCENKLPVINITSRKEYKLFIY